MKLYYFPKTPRVRIDDKDYEIEEERLLRGAYSGAMHEWKRQLQAVPLFVVSEIITQPRHAAEGERE